MKGPETQLQVKRFRPHNERLLLQPCAAGDEANPSELDVRTRFECEPVGGREKTQGEHKREKERERERERDPATEAKGRMGDR